MTPCKNDNLGPCLHVYIGQLSQYVGELRHVPLNGGDGVGRAHLDGEEDQHNEGINSGLVADLRFSLLLVSTMGGDDVDCKESSVCLKCSTVGGDDDDCKVLSLLVVPHRGEDSDCKELSLLVVLNNGEEDGHQDLSVLDLFLSQLFVNELGTKLPGPCVLTLLLIQ